MKNGKEKKLRKEINETLTSMENFITKIRNLMKKPDMNANKLLSLKTFLKRQTFSKFPLINLISWIKMIENESN